MANQSKPYRIAKDYGQDRVGTLFGLVFVSHQIGGAVAALGAGWIYSTLGEYHYAFLLGAVMGLLAAGLSMGMRSSSNMPPPVPLDSELAKA